MRFGLRIGAALAMLLHAIPATAATPAEDAFVAWARTHAIDLPVCSSIFSGADYSNLAKRIGSARVVALGEPVHGAHEPLAFRNCLFRYLVEKQGFTAIALESGLHESRRLHDYAAGGPGDVRDVAWHGFTWGFWRYPENIELLEWVRAYNLDPQHTRKVAVYGIDMSGGDADGNWARARITLDAGLAYLARAAPARSARVRKDIAPFLGHFSAPAYRALSGKERTALRRSLDRVLEIFDSNRAVLLSASSRKDFDWARQNIVAAQQLQILFEVSETPDPGGRLLPGEYRADAAREVAMADNTMWALHREGPEGRILLFAHNGHTMNAHTRGGIWSVYTKSPAAMGFHLRRALGRELLIMGGSSPTRGEGAGGPGEIDAALARVGREHFLVDIHSATGLPAQWLSREKHLSANYTTESLVCPREAFDLLIFFDRLTRSQKDR